LPDGALASGASPVGKGTGRRGIGVAIASVLLAARRRFAMSTVGDATMFKFGVLSLCALALALLPAGSVQATFVTHNGTDVLLQDDFESRTVGLAPDVGYSPWVISNAAEGGTITVVNDASPGPAQGNKYVRLAGPPSSDLDGGYVGLKVSFPVVTSGTIHAEWMMYVEGPDTTGHGYNIGNFGFQQPNGSARVWGSFDRTGPGYASYYSSNAGDYVNIANVPISHNKWQKWAVDYTFAPTGYANDSYVITVDGNSSAPLETWRTTDGISAFVIGENGTSAPYSLFVDAVPTPEPSSLVLMTAGALGLLAYAWRKRK
jgi:hypothetical protein